MNLEELKRKREENLLIHKKKKQAYYIKSKFKNNIEGKRKVSSINYEDELFSGNFNLKIKEIVKKQKKHIESREELIQKRIEEYREKKHNYYSKHKEKRLEYDKEYREKKKEELKLYRKEYYRKNKEKILAKQKENREKLKKQMDT